MVQNTQQLEAFAWQIRKWVVHTSQIQLLQAAVLLQGGGQCLHTFVSNKINCTNEDDGTAAPMSSACPIPIHHKSNRIV